MAWNEPGGSKDRDPWGNRGQDQGPPDLDEVLRKFQDKVTSLFGGKGGKGGRRSTGQGGLFGFGLVAIVLVVVWFISGIYIVEEGRQGVILQFGKYKETTDPGLHWYPRFIQSKEIVDVRRVRSISLGMSTDEALMLTQDENIVDVKFTVQYEVNDPKNFLFNVRDPQGVPDLEATIRQATESAVREVVGKNGMDFIITEGRPEVAARAQRLVQEILDGYNAGITVTRLNMQDAQAPQQVQHAFDDAIKAREDEQRQINEAEAYSNDILPRARGQAARIVQEANAYRDQVVAQAEGDATRFTRVLAEYERAPAVTRERLYLEAMEDVLGNSSKVMVDVQQGNSLLYLPLDRMGKGGSALESAGRAMPPIIPPPAASDTGSGGRSRDRFRDRETR
jgi:membrane protease subunit HflK